MECNIFYQPTLLQGAAAGAGLGAHGGRAPRPRRRGFQHHARLLQRRHQRAADHRGQARTQRAAGAQQRGQPPRARRLRAQISQLSGGARSSRH